MKKILYFTLLVQSITVPLIHCMEAPSLKEQGITTIARHLTNQ